MQDTEATEEEEVVIRCQKSAVASITYLFPRFLFAVLFGNLRGHGREQWSSHCFECNALNSIGRRQEEVRNINRCSADMDVSRWLSGCCAQHPGMHLTIFLSEECAANFTGIGRWGGQIVPPITYSSAGLYPVGMFEPHEPASKRRQSVNRGGHHGQRFAGAVQ